MNGSLDARKAIGNNCFNHVGVVRSWKWGINPKLAGSLIAKFAIVIRPSQHTDEGELGKGCAMFQLGQNLFANSLALVGCDNGHWRQTQTGFRLVFVFNNNVAQETVTDQSACLVSDNLKAPFISRIFANSFN